MDIEILKHIELLVGSIGVVLGVFFSLFLLSNKKDQPKSNVFLAIYLLAFSLRIGKSLFHNYVELDASLRNFFLTTLLCVGPAIWLYTLYLLSPPEKSRVRDYYHFIPFFVIASICWMIPNDGSLLFAIFYDFLIVHMLGYTIYSFIWFKKQQRSEELKVVSKIRNWLNYFLIINLVLITAYILISELIIPFYLGLSFLFSLVVISLSFWALKNPLMFKTPVEKYKSSNIDNQEAQQLIAKLKAHMIENKSFTDPTLTLTKLSNNLEVSSKDLSQSINQIEGLNYSQLISQYRVEEVKHLMQQKSHANYTIAAIAYDSGFSSISSFNTAFKKFTKITAVEYRKSIKAK